MQWTLLPEMMIWKGWGHPAACYVVHGLKEVPTDFLLGHCHGQVAAKSWRGAVT